MRGSFKEHCFDFFLSPSADWAPPQVVVDVKCWHARSQPHVDSRPRYLKELVKQIIGRFAKQACSELFDEVVLFLGAERPRASRRLSSNRDQREIQMSGISSEA